MRAISKEKIEVFAESKQIKYYEVSAKKGINVDIIFKELIESIPDNVMKGNALTELEVYKGNHKFALRKPVR